MKVLEQCFCPLCLLPPPPLFLCYCVCPSPSSAACTLCTVMYSLFLRFLFFLSNCLTHRHSLIKVLFLSQREVNSNYWGDFYTWMCLCFFPSLCTGSGVFLFFFLLLCVSYKCSLKIARLDPKHHDSNQHPVLILLSWFICWRINRFVTILAFTQFAQFACDLFQPFIIKPSPDLSLHRFEVIEVICFINLRCKSSALSG